LTPPVSFIFNLLPSALAGIRQQAGDEVFLLLLFPLPMLQVPCLCTGWGGGQGGEVAIAFSFPKT